MTLHDRIGAEALDKPFFVQWGWSGGGEWANNANDERYASLDEAMARYEEFRGDGGEPVWLGEVGDYRTAAGNLVRDWIYFLWNAPVERSAWGPCPERGQGYPYATWTRRLVKYEPFGK
jgi:hypothetical protein